MRRCGCFQKQSVSQEQTTQGPTEIHLLVIHLSSVMLILSLIKSSIYLCKATC